MTTYFLKSYTGTLNNKYFQHISFGKTKRSLNAVKTFDINYKSDYLKNKEQWLLSRGDF